MRTFLFFFLILILLVNSVFAIYAPVSEDPGGGEPVYENADTSNIVIDNTNKKVKLPPGFVNVRVIPKDEDLPEDMKMIGVDVEENSTGNDTMVTEEDLPEDMADILGDDNTGNTDSGGNSGSPDTTVDNGNVNVGNPDVSTGTTEDVSQGQSENPNGSTLKVLWFVMACLIIVLIIAVVYIMANKKASPAGEQ